jgi:isocitrate lyase
MFAKTKSRTLGGLFENGGYAGTVYSFIIAWVGILCAFTTMGELASMYVCYGMLAYAC